MPSKGVQVYTYIAAPGCSIELSVPGQTVVRSELRQFWNGDLEVESSKIRSLLDKTGRFAFKVLHGGRVLTEQWIGVNALTGRASGGTMDAMDDTPTVLHRDPDVHVSYGFYAAGQGHGLLPGRHQCYITVTPDNSDWMGRVAPPGSPQADQPFRRLVLPAAHDVGMNTMDTCAAVLRHAGGAVVRTLLLAGGARHARVLADLADAASGPAVAALAPAIVRSLAVTQKDPLAAMLALGARYFEFRPALAHAQVRRHLPDGTLYFQHGAVPGMAYGEFLRGVVRFLGDHPAEIVVVQLRWDGVPAECERPSQAQLDACLRAALGEAAAGGPHPVAAGTLADLRAGTPAALRRAGRRLLLLAGVDSVSTYTDAGNATLDGDRIVAGFVAALRPGCCDRGGGGGGGGGGDAPRAAFVNIQCQATASNVPRAVAYSVLAAGAANSCLLATKAACDARTLPWVRDHARRACGDDDLVVVMNDFFDGATADVAVELSRQRLQVG